MSCRKVHKKSAEKKTGTGMLTINTITKCCMIRDLLNAICSWVNQSITPITWEFVVKEH